MKYSKISYHEAFRYFSNLNLFIQDCIMMLMYFFLIWRAIFSCIDHGKKISIRSLMPHVLRFQLSFPLLLFQFKLIFYPTSCFDDDMLFSCIGRNLDRNVFHISEEFHGKRISIRYLILHGLFNRIIVNYYLSQVSIVMLICFFDFYLFGEVSIILVNIRITHFILYHTHFPYSKKNTKF